jgi:hypothetical protein
MLIYLKELNYYFLTNNNPERKEHMLEEFKEYKLIEVDPEPNLSRNKSGASGFLKMFELEYIYQILIKYQYMQYRYKI